MFPPTTSVPVSDTHANPPPRQHDVPRGQEAWRDDELLSQPPKTYPQSGGKFCCSLTLRILIVVLCLVALVLCIVTQVVPFYKESQIAGSYELSFIYRLWSTKGKFSGFEFGEDAEEDLRGAAVCLVIGLVLSAIGLVLGIAYAIVLCVHRSQRNRDYEDANERYRARFQKLEDMSGEMQNLDAGGAGAAYRTSAERRSELVDQLRREAHEDSVGLYERERKRRRADRGLWFTVLFVIVAAFILLLVGFILAVTTYNDEFKADEEDYEEDGLITSLRVGVWLALVSAVVMLVAFILCVLRPCVRSYSEVLAAPAAYSAYGNRAPSTRRGEYELYPNPVAQTDDAALKKSQRVATGVPLQPAGGNVAAPVAEDYATYHPQYGRGYYYDNGVGETVNERAVGKADEL